MFKASEIASQLGNPKAMNIVLLGALVEAMQIPGEIQWEEIIRSTVKPAFADLNVAAFKAGQEQVRMNA